MEEREKDNLANGDIPSKDYGIIDIDETIKNDEIVTINDPEDVDYDQEYMTNVSNNLVSEVDRVLNEISEEEKAEETAPEEVEETPKEVEEAHEEVVEEERPVL